MIFIGDYFALGLVIVLFMFFFDNKISLRHMPATSKLFIAGLATTALTALVDILTGYLLQKPDVPLWQNMLANTMYFIVSIIATSLIAMYLFTKILEHTHEKHCMDRAKIGLSALFIIYSVIIFTNPWTKLVFYFSEDYIYCRGPLNVAGYVVALFQLLLVAICFIRNRATASATSKRVILMITPVIPLCALIHKLHPDIMLNTFIIALVDTVIFLTFQGQRQGVHSLTQLNDRHRFFTEVDYRISKGEPFQIFLINIKNFGSVNQKFGHKFGDEILYQLAFSLEKLMKDGMTFHMNGTVFAIVLRYTYQNTSEKQCGTLLDFLEKGLHCAGFDIDLDYIMAHYVANGNEVFATELYEIMEFAITKAHKMKQRYIQCGHDDGIIIARRRYLLERMQKIDREHGFEVWFQPTKCLATGRFCSMEALIRMREPDGKLISPAEFIPLAEQTGLISSITWFVVEDVCRTLKNTPELGDVSVSINMPQTQLLEKGFIPRFTGIVDQAGIDHNRICIEFTEREMLENFRQTLIIMEELTLNGFRFFLDDFGVSYSNFNCLLQLPFKVIKLDPCLVNQGKDGHKDYTTLHTLTNLFHTMELTVIAEGAETDEEVQKLTDQGVDRIQGFALARPMPLDKLLEFYTVNSY